MGSSNIFVALGMEAKHSFSIQLPNLTSKDRLGFPPYLP